MRRRERLVSFTIVNARDSLPDARVSTAYARVIAGGLHFSPNCIKRNALAGIMLDFIIMLSQYPWPVVALMMAGYLDISPLVSRRGQFGRVLLIKNIHISRSLRDIISLDLGWSLFCSYNM